MRERVGGERERERERERGREGERERERGGERERERGGERERGERERRGSNRLYFVCIRGLYLKITKKRDVDQQ